MPPETRLFEEKIHMNWKPLDKIDSSLYKGIAILMIVIHNFMHIFPAPKENEFNFKPNRFFDLLSLLLNEPENVIRVSFSFFGHFGVQIFIFLSAYGLTKKYYLRKITYWPFIWGRIIKIYPSFILAILTWAIITGWIYPGFGLFGPLKVLHLNIESLLFKLTPLPGKYLSPVGPWWFIPFIFQFYFAFPFLLHLYSKWGWTILLIISATSTLVSIAAQGIIIIQSIGIGGIKIYFTMIGHLPELCLGIYLASRDDTVIRIPALMLLVAFIIYFLGNIYEIFWYVNHISFLILLLAAFSYVIPKIKDMGIIKKIFLFFGSISMPLFLVNGFLRDPFFSWAKEHNDWLLTIVLCMLSLMISLLVALALSKIERHLMSRLI